MRQSIVEAAARSLPHHASWRAHTAFILAASIGKPAHTHTRSTANEKQGWDHRLEMCNPRCALLHRPHTPRTLCSLFAPLFSVDFAVRPPTSIPSYGWKPKIMRELRRHPPKFSTTSRPRERQHCCAAKCLFSSNSAQPVGTLSRIAAPPPLSPPMPIAEQCAHFLSSLGALAPLSY